MKHVNIALLITLLLCDTVRCYRFSPSRINFVRLPSRHTGRKLTSTQLRVAAPLSNLVRKINPTRLIAVIRRIKSPAAFTIALRSLLLVFEKALKLIHHIYVSIVSKVMWRQKESATLVQEPPKPAGAGKNDDRKGDQPGGSVSPIANAQEENRHKTDETIESKSEEFVSDRDAVEVEPPVRVDSEVIDMISNNTNTMESLAATKEETKSPEYEIKNTNDMGNQAVDSVVRTNANEEDTTRASLEKAGREDAVITKNDESAKLYTQLQPSTLAAATGQPVREKAILVRDVPIMESLDESDIKSYEDAKEIAAKIATIYSKSFKSS